jgi:hypothetical protein
MIEFVSWLTYKCANVSTSAYNANHVCCCYEGDRNNRKNKMYRRKKKPVTRTASARIITSLFMTSVLKFSRQQNSVKSSRAGFADV